MLTKYKSLFMAILILWGGCGILTGNPENTPLGDSGPPSLDLFAKLQREYQTAQQNQTEEQTDCGFFTESSAAEEIEIGRECIRSAFDKCQEAFYLYDETLADDHRFASFVVITSTCEVSVHAVSTDEERFVGDRSKSCSTLEKDTPIELACEIDN